MLDAHHLELEQRYGNTKRWLINRLSLGSGILCGLDVVASSDNTLLRVTSGVAIDGSGARDHRSPDDRADRPRSADGRLWPPGRRPHSRRRARHSRCLLPRVRSGAEPGDDLECGPEQSCAERTRSRAVSAAHHPGDPAPPGFITPEQCARIFAQPPQGVSRREVVCDTLDIDCAPPGETCVPLAVITLNGRWRHREH